MNKIDFWLTKGDQSIKLEKQKSILTFGNTFNNYANIEVFDAQTRQKSKFDLLFNKKQLK